MSFGGFHPMTPAANTAASSPRTRDTDGFSRMPTGTSSLLFPGTATGRSPMLSASPAHQVPFTGVGEAVTPSALLGAPAIPPTPASRQTNQNPFSPSYVRGQPAFSGTALASTTGTPLARGLRTAPPPIVSMLDAAAPVPVVAPTATPSGAAPLVSEGAPPSAASTTLSFASAMAAQTPSATAAVPVGVPTGNANRSDVRDEFWVTIFGYHSKATLAAFLDEVRPPGGELMQHRLGVGPWAHVQFREWRQQQQALAKSGKVMHGVMLGVIEGVAPSDDALSMPAATAGTGLPLKLHLPRAAAPTPTLQTRPSTRDLGRAGWWTRLCEYVFGW